MSQRQPLNTPETRLGVMERHILQSPHPLHDTHVLVQHTHTARGKGINELVPRVIGTSIPCQNAGLQYMIYVLSHFCPFSHSNPLIPAGQTVHDVFKAYKFSTDSLDIHYEGSSG